MQLHEHLHRLTEVAEARAMDYMLSDNNGKLQFKIVANLLQPVSCQQCQVTKLMITDKSQTSIFTNYTEGGSTNTMIRNIND